MTKARNIANLLSTSNGKIAGSNLDVSFENITDTGNEGLTLPKGTTAQRGSTEGQIRYNTDNDALELRDDTEFVALESSVGLTSVSPLGITPSDNTGGGNNITLTGTNFKSGATVKFIGNDGTEFNATSVSFTNSTTVVATAPELTESKEPFDVKIINPSGNSAQIDNQIQINTSPVWSTASGTLATINDTATGTHATVTATDADGGDTITYSESTSVLSGAGLSLNSSTGAISGDPTNVSSNTTYTFGINASDGVDTVNRSFNIVVNKVNDGSTAARAANSADDLYSLGITTAGVYYINHAGTQVPIWCDFSQSAGYMLAISINTANPNTNTVWTTSSSDDNEIQVGDTSPQSRDVISTMRRNRQWRYAMIKYENTHFSPANTYYTNPVIYDNGSNLSTGIVGVSNTTISRASGNSGILPTSNCSNNGSYSASTLYLNQTGAQHRDAALSNYDDNSQNMAGFFYSGNYEQTFEGGCNYGNTSKFELYIR